MPSNTSTIQEDSSDSQPELCHLTTIHKRAQQQAMVLPLFCNSKEEGRVYKASAKWNLAYNPSSVTALPEVGLLYMSGLLMQCS